MSVPPVPSHRRAESSADPRLSVVIVNYNSWPDVARLVSRLAATAEVTTGRCEVVVVDNASTGVVPAELGRPRPGVRLILHAENVGFAAGVNAGWKSSRGRWLLLLNPDVVVGDDLLARVLARIDAFANRPGGPPGVVGFGLRNPDGTPQPSVGAEPSLGRSLRGLLRPRSRRKYQPAGRTRPGPVPWVTGACALVDAELLEELGGMDEDFFLYYEEVALCRSARDRGRAVEFDPSVEVVHLRPLQNRPVGPLLRVITRHSQLLYFRKHVSHRQFVGLCWAVAAEAWVRGAWSLATRRPEDRRAWRVVGVLAAAARRGATIRGRAVRELAETAIGTKRTRFRGTREEVLHPGPLPVLSRGDFPSK